MADPHEHTCMVCLWPMSYHWSREQPDSPCCPGCRCETGGPCEECGEFCDGECKVRGF